MTKRLLFFLLTIFAVFCCDSAPAQALPKIQLRSTFPALTLLRPVWMSEAPDGSGRFFIVEEGGRIVMVKKGSDGSVTNEFLNIEDRNPHVHDEEGLLSIAFHPQFAENHTFYIYYNQQLPTNRVPAYPFYTRCSVISEMKVSEGDTNRADTNTERRLMIVPQPYGNHKGGQVSFGPDGDLYIGLGDGGGQGDPSNNGQNTSTFLAKILRVDVNHRSETVTPNGIHRRSPYAIPADNPLVGEPDLNGIGVVKEIYAWGLRNPWRFSWDRKTGDMWCGDVGQDLWEEIDLIVKGGNYGWNVREGMHHFKPGPPGAQYIDPVIEYPHKPELLAQSKFPNHSVGLCVIGGYVYRGKKYPALDGVYLYADYALGTIWGFRYADGKVTDYGTLLSQPKNIVSFAEDLDGELYVLAFDGHVYSIEVK